MTDGAWTNAKRGNRKIIYLQCRARAGGKLKWICNKSFFVCSQVQSVHTFCVCDAKAPRRPSCHSGHWSQRYLLRPTYTLLLFLPVNTVMIRLHVHTIISVISQHVTQATASEDMQASMATNTVRHSAITSTHFFERVYFYFTLSAPQKLISTLRT
jgi:hypothetical protein